MFKKKIDPVRVWAQIESTGMLLNMDMAPWYSMFISVSLRPCVSSTCIESDVAL